MAKTDRSSEYDDIRELKDLIKETMRRAIERIPEDRVRPGVGHEEMRRMMARFAPTPPIPGRRVEKDEVEPSTGKFRAFHKLRKRILRAAERAVIGFRSHAIPFAAVNTFLIFLWILVDFGGHPWFLYPLGAWGIGLMCHLTAVRQTLRKKREIQSLPELPEQETRVVRKMQSGRAGFREHLTAVTSLSGFLIMVDIITGGSFPWSLIPTFAMATGLFTHWAAYSVRYKKRKTLVYGWMDGGIPRERRASGEVSDERGMVEPSEKEAPEVREVERLKTQILKTLDKLRESGSTIGEDLYPLMDTYSEQIRDLCRKEAEVAEVIDLVPTKDLENERAGLEQKLAAETSDNLQREYQKSLRELDRQVASLNKLTTQREILALRIRSAVNSLRQIQIDLARMGSVSIADKTSTEQVKAKFDELSQYLDDLSDGYSELD
jgi:hypothetical protein